MGRMQALGHKKHGRVATRLHDGLLDLWREMREEY